MKRKKKEGGGANWMDTYGDLVTLLLCFFVLLYSISTIDQAKWIQIVKSFNPDAKEVSQIAENPDIDANDEVPGGQFHYQGRRRDYFGTVLCYYCRSQRLC